MLDMLLCRCVHSTRLLSAVRHVSTFPAPRCQHDRLLPPHLASDQMLMWTRAYRLRTSAVTPCCGCILTTSTSADDQYSPTRLGVLPRSGDSLLGHPSTPRCSAHSRIEWAMPACCIFPRALPGQCACLDTLLIPGLNRYGHKP